MAIETCQHVNGDVIDEGKTYSVDHIEQCFVVKFRSMAGVGTDTIKDQLQKKWEVIDIKEINHDTFLR